MAQRTGLLEGHRSDASRLATLRPSGRPQLIPAALGVTRAALSTLLNERSSLSSEMALRVQKAFGVSMDTLMRMQNRFDIARARAREAEIAVERYARIAT